MEEPAETREETKHSRSFGSYALWAGVIILLYGLGLGFSVRMVGKGGWQAPTWIVSLYSPVNWAYNNTLLHKPLGLYLHLWCPQHFDTKGERQNWKK
jgi:hypothetical protein